MVLPLTVYDFEVACCHPPIPMIRCQKIRPPRSVPLVLSRGFTLIELSIVVVIISMLLSLGLGVLNAQLSSAAQAETKKRQAIIKDALTAYLGANKRLPCPDDPNTDGVTGEEDVLTGACTAIGVVPYVTLGLSRDVALDGWGNFMSYSIPAGDGDCATTGGTNWSRDDCFGAAKESPYSLFGGTGALRTLAASNVLAVVVSHGPNGFAAWGRQGNRLNVEGMRCEEAHNAITGICSGQKPDGSDWTAADFFGGEFTPEVDDVVVALTRDEAINTLVKQGTLKSAEGQLVEDLAKLRNEKLNKKVLGSCGASFVDPPPADPLPNDPWGNPYVIVEGSDTATSLPICICSTRKIGAPPATPAHDSTCSPVAPTVCVEINLAEVNQLRIPMGMGVCPPPP